MNCASCPAALSGHFIAIDFRDEGPGIETSVRTRMFEPFFSAHSVKDATGMGLAVVHGIVHEHGGHILVDSDPPNGTTFTVLLPVAQAEQRLEQDDYQILSGKRVLVVDDELGFGEFVSDLLLEYRCAAEVQRDSHAALARFSKGPDDYDAVIADFAMPGFTGTELAEAMLAIRPSLPIILCTGYIESLSEADTAVIGIRAVLRKPVTASALLSHVARCWR